MMSLKQRPRMMKLMKDSREENEVAEDKLLGIIAVSLADLQAEKEQVLQLRDLAQRVHESGLKSKFDKLREVITDPKHEQEKLHPSLPSTATPLISWYDASGVWSPPGT